MTWMDEETRLAVLAGYAVLDTPAEDAFDDLTNLVASLCEAPISLISLVDRDRQWFKSRVGVDDHETPRTISFCAHAIEREGLFVVSNAVEDPRFADNPLVLGSPYVRFYAGMPLVDDVGAALGTLCVIDVKPRVLTPLQDRALQVLARQVVAQLQLRRQGTTLRAELVHETEHARLREKKQTEQLARETQLRAEVERAHGRASFLADAGKLLAASLDTTRTLDALAHLAVPNVADVCSVAVCDDDGTLHRLGEAGLDHEAAEAVRDLRERTQCGATLTMKHAIDERRPVLFADYREWLAARVPPGHPYLEMLEKLGITSTIAAPMMLGDRVLGVLSVAVQASSGRKYDENDLVTMGELAQRAAVALENARLFGEARRERARAELANDTKDRFLAAISHDLRTPLSAILGWAQMASRASTDATFQKRALDVIERNARAQSRLIEDLLDISRIATGQLRVEREPVNLVAVIEGALETLRPAADAKGLRVESSLDPEAMNGNGDFGRLQQVVWNLGSNAIKFAKSSGRIGVRLTREDDRARLVVEDDGRGIPAKLLPHVFDSFRQDDEGVGRRLGGLGLGLAIAKHIVEAVGGTITACSDGEGMGATFTVDLPLVTTLSSHAPALIGTRARRVDTAMLFGARVLVVDDDAYTRSALSELLSAQGVIVSTAATAADGFVAFTCERPHVLVADLVLAGASGYDLVRRVRDLSADDGGRTPALALTASTSAAERARVLAAGFQDYVPKPVEPAELLAVVVSLHALSQ